MSLFLSKFWTALIFLHRLSSYRGNLQSCRPSTALLPSQTVAGQEKNLNSNKKMLRKGRLMSWKLGNYLGRFYQIDSLLGSLSLASSPSTVDRGTLTSWPWNIAACWESLCVWWSDGPLQEFHSKSDIWGWVVSSVRTQADTSVFCVLWWCGVLQCCVLSYLWISTDNFEHKVLKGTTEIKT